MVIAMLKDDPVFVQANETFYSVTRLKEILALYPHLGGSKPVDDPELMNRVKRVFGEASWSEASAKAADAKQALNWLHERDWRAAYMIDAICIVGLSVRHAQHYLAREYGEHVSHMTVHRWKVDGLALMSAYLCGRIPKEPVDDDVTNLP